MDSDVGSVTSVESNLPSGLQNDFNSALDAEVVQV